MQTGRMRRWPGGIVEGLLVCAVWALTIGWADSWEAMETQLGKVTSIQAEFTQEKHLKILLKPLISKGKIYFKVPGSLRWEYRSPIENILTMHQGQSHRWVRKEGRLVPDTGMPVKMMDVVMEEISQWLQGRFLDNPNFSAERVGADQIRLTPKNPAMERIIQSVSIQLSAIPGAIDSVTITETKDNFTRITFHDVRLNQELDEKLFTVTAP